MRSASNRPALLGIFCGLALMMLSGCSPSLNSLLKHRHFAAAVDYAVVKKSPAAGAKVSAAVRAALAPGLFAYSVPEEELRQKLPGLPAEFMRSYAVIYVRYDWNQTSIKYLTPGFVLRFGSDGPRAVRADVENLAPLLNEVAPRPARATRTTTIGDVLIMFLTVGIIRPQSGPFEYKSDPVPPTTERFLSALYGKQSPIERLIMGEKADTRSGVKSVEVFLILKKTERPESAPLEFVVETVASGQDLSHQISLLESIPIPAASTFEARFSTLFAGRMRYLSELAAPVAQ